MCELIISEMANEQVISLYIVTCVSIKINALNFFLLFSVSAGYVRLDEHMKELTKYKGENLRIRCEITGFPVPKYQWFKDDKPLRDGGKHNIRITPWGSR